jgi:predicted transcriptional regulator
MVNDNSIKISVNKDYTISVKAGNRPVETLMSTYINSEITGYKEPETKDTTKGPIGFTKVKKLTNMLMLLKMKTKEIAELVGVSEQVVRNWLLEDHFRDKLTEECREFSLSLYSSIEKKVGIEVMSSDKQGKRVIRDLVAPNDFPELVDSCLYGNCISENILKHVVSNLKKLLSEFKKISNEGKERDLLEIKKTLLIFEILVDYLYEPKAAFKKTGYSVGDIKIREGLGKLVYIPLLLLAQKIIERQRVSKAERMQVSYIMAMVEDYLVEEKS